MFTNSAVRENNFLEICTLRQGWGMKWGASKRIKPLLW